MWLYKKGEPEAVNLQHTQSIRREDYEEREEYTITFYQFKNEVTFTFSSEKERDEYFEMIIIKLEDMESKLFRPGFTF